MLGRFLFRLARLVSRHPLTGKIVGLGFQYGSFLLPVRRLADSETTVIFAHPRPAYDDHLLVVPKRAIATFPDLLAPNRLVYFAAILQAARQLLDTQGWDNYSLAVNGGRNQEVSQVHFHLYRGRAHWRPFVGEDPTHRRQNDSAVFSHPRPRRALHLVLPVQIALDADRGNALQTRLGQLIEEGDLIARGYTVFVQFGQGPTDGHFLHLVSGAVVND
ncbi:MAG: HIT domain-containing protein [Candidatus Latescibacteria bacterium]|nr:HIT domain-containing protein [Candidatus Latescibacterota bacterium]